MFVSDLQAMGPSPSPHLGQVRAIGPAHWPERSWVPSMPLLLQEEEIITSQCLTLISALGKSNLKNKELNGNKRNTVFDVRTRRLETKVSKQKDMCGAQWAGTHRRPTLACGVISMLAPPVSWGWAGMSLSLHPVQVQNALQPPGTDSGT